MVYLFLNIISGSNEMYRLSVNALKIEKIMYCFIKQINKTGMEYDRLQAVALRAILHTVARTVLVS